MTIFYVLPVSPALPRVPSSDSQNLSVEKTKINVRVSEAPPPPSLLPLLASHLSNNEHFDNPHFTCRLSSTLLPRVHRNSLA
jgi:hypothetical protein